MSVVHSVAVGDGSCDARRAAVMLLTYTLQGLGRDAFSVRPPGQHSLLHWLAACTSAAGTYTGE